MTDRSSSTHIALRRSAAAMGGLLLLAMAGCHVGPKYVVPTAPVPPAYKELGPDAFKETAEWQHAHPEDALPRGAWWTIFNDPQLNALEPQVEGANQTIREADANLRASRAEIRVRKADRFPTLGIDSTTSSGRYSRGQSYFNPAPPYGNNGSLQYPVQLSYEVDLWGQVRKNIDAGKEESQATFADRVNILLLLQAELASDYLQLRSEDSLQRLLNDTVKQYSDALRITTNRYNGGIAVKSDVTQAETQLQQAKVQASDVAIQRAQFEHAIAILVGKAPSELTVAFDPLLEETQPPVIPTGLPSQLLERRPDIAAAERRANEGNEAIGIAQSAFYPNIVLGGSLGYGSNSTVQSLFSPSNVIYSLGPGITYTFLDGGRRNGIREEAYAQFDRNAADYKQTVLTAFQQVEDNLVALRVLKDEASQQRAATASAQETVRISNNRYVGGVDTFLQVITAQTTALNNERNDIDILRRRMDASVQLVKALGGGWDRTQLPPQ